MALPGIFPVLLLAFYYMQPKQPRLGQLFQTAHLKFADADKKLDVTELKQALVS